MLLPDNRKLPVKSGNCFVSVPELNNEAVLDRETGLIWEKSPSTDNMDWNNAVYYAYNKKVGGRKGWKLPTVEELLSLVDTSNSPTLSSGHPFESVQRALYWLATTDTEDVGEAWHVDFDYSGEAISRQ